MTNQLTCSPRTKTRTLSFSGWIIALALALATGSCGLNEVGGPGNSNPSGLAFRDAYAWPLSTPAAQGMDSTRVFSGLQQIRNSSFIHSFLVVRNDSLIVEYYAPGFLKDNDFQIHALSASFTSALVGIAIDNGLIRSVRDGIFNYFPEVDTAGLDPKRRAWTIEHLLTMRAGAEWKEHEDHSTLFNSTTNWISVALGLPVKYAPGDTFIFASPNANILSAILTKATRMSTYRFAEQYLFDPLKISVRSWGTDPQGVFLGGSGMRFTPRDLARFGQLYLRRGFIDGKQIVPRTWIEQSLLPRNKGAMSRGDLAPVNFGYTWWTNVDLRDSLFMALGYGGQAIYVVPGSSMIIVTIADGEAAPVEGDANERALLAILKKYFL